MVGISYRLALTCFVAVPCIVAASKVFGDFIRTLSTETQDALAESNTTAEEAITPPPSPPIPPISPISPYLGRGGDHPPPSPPREIRPRGQEVAREEPRFSQVISSISTTRAFAAERSEEEIYGRGMKAYQDCVVRTARL